MRWYEVAQGGEVMARRGDAVYCALATRSPEHRIPALGGGRPVAG